MRTATELDILTCSKDEDHLPLIHRRIRLPSPLADDPDAKYIADASVSSHSPQIVCITDTGFWTVHSFQIRNETSKLVASGRLITPSLMMQTAGGRWWKTEWNDSNDLFVMENSGLYLLDVNVLSLSLTKLICRPATPNWCFLRARMNSSEASPQLILFEELHWPS